MSPACVESLYDLVEGNGRPYLVHLGVLDSRVELFTVYLGVTPVHFDKIYAPFRIGLSILLVVSVAARDAVIAPTFAACVQTSIRVDSDFQSLPNRSSNTPIGLTLEWT